MAANQISGGLLSVFLWTAADTENFLRSLLDRLRPKVEEDVTDTNDLGSQLNILHEALTLYRTQNPDSLTDGCAAPKLVSSILQDVLIPLLSKVQSAQNVGSDGHAGRALALLSCDVIVAALHCADKITEEYLWKVLLNSLFQQETQETTDGRCTLDIRWVLQIMKSYLKDRAFEQCCFFSDGWDDKFVHTLISLLGDSDLSDCYVGGVASVLVKLFSHSEDKVSHNLSLVWEKVLRIYRTSESLPSSGLGSSSTVSEKPYVILAGLADLYFPGSSEQTVTFDLKTISEFWLLIQEGLVQKSPATRKLSLYLLKRIVDISSRSDVCVMPTCQSSEQSCAIFWWSPNYNVHLSKIWEDFILLIETLNEKQIHVIRPLFPLLDRLIKACSNSQASADSSRLLHTSWVVTVVRRAVIHESAHVVWWAVRSLLTMDPAPLLLHGQAQYVSGEFLSALKETKLYSREPSEPLGSQPEIGKLLQEFFLSVWKTLDRDNRAHFFQAVLVSLRADNWGSLPLMFITQALSRLPRTRLWDKASVQAVRDIISTSLATMEPFTRGASQCFMIQSLVSHLDPAIVSPADVGVALAACCKQESLTRGTTLWQKASPSLAQISEEEQPAECWRKPALCTWLKKSFNSFLKSESAPAEGTALQLCRMLLLLLDGWGINQQETALIDSCLLPVKDTLSRVISHAYMPSETADRALEVLLVMMEEVGTLDSSVDDAVVKYISSTLTQCLEEIIHQIGRGKDNIKSLGDVGLLHLYLRMLESLGKNPWVGIVSGHALLEEVYPLIRWSVTVINKLAPLCDNGNNEITEDKQIGLVVGMSLLAGTCNILESLRPSMPRSKWLCYPSVKDSLCCLMGLHPKSGLMKPTTDDSPVGRQAWGKLVSLFLTSQWECLKFALTVCEVTPSSLGTPSVCLEAITTGSGESILPVIACLRMILPKCVEHGQETETIEVISRLWQCVMEVQRSTIFWPELRAFVAMAFQSDLMTLGSASPVTQILNKYAMELIKLGEERKGVVNVLIDQLCTISRQGQSLSAMTQFSDIVAEALAFGNVPERIDRALFDTWAYVDSLKEDCSVNELLPFISRPDLLVRVTIFSLLTSLDPASESHRDFVSTLITSLIHKHNKVNKSKAAWNFANSLQHRMRHRLIQGLLVLEPFMRTELIDRYTPSPLTSVCPLIPQKLVELLGRNLWLAVRVWDYVWGVLASENQPSVRNQLEWIALRLLRSHHVTLLPRLWEMFTSATLTDKRHMSLCSLMFVVSCLGPYLPTSTQEEFYNKAMTCIFPWCTVHHFNTRIHAQVTLRKLWHQCHTSDLQPLTQRYPMIQSCLDFNKEESNSSKNSEKLAAHYMFNVFDFVEDFSAETIFETFPKLCNLSDEEWISPLTFTRNDATWCESDQHYLPLYSGRDQLKKCIPGAWRLKGEDKYSSRTVEEEVIHVGGDVQKKILPWRFLRPDPEADDLLTVRTARKDGLVLVTSLIEKIPNLGGLCRTSEIFGVSEFVVSSLHCLADKAFVSLSVTAHKWLPVTEVRPFQLVDFLEERRRAGYTLVGVEQTANSVSLAEYSFPQKTLLILGNEKEGIPPELMSLLDVCVEIPQQGVIRSLNVHVSGALLVWEYARQHLHKP